MATPASRNPPRNRMLRHTSMYLLHGLFRSEELTPFQFIKGPLTEELSLTNAKRPRRFATKVVLNHLANQLFAVDWFVYKSPATRLDDWAIQLGNTFSSARIGEYIESSCRSKTGRGLYYKVSPVLHPLVSISLNDCSMPGPDFWGLFKRAG
jgi:hypothetical protein